MSSSEFIMVHVILGFSTILIGVLAKLIRPEKRNSLTGYRTRRSQLSQETWDFANEYGGNMLLWSSVVTLVVEIFSALVLENEASIYVTIGVMLIGMAVAIGSTEYQLSQRFDKEGGPKPLSGDRY